MKLGFEPEKIFTYNKNSLLPASVMGVFLVYFFSRAEFSEQNFQNLQFLLVSTSVLTVILLGCLRVLSAVMSVSVILISYFLITFVRREYGEDYIFSAGYNIWSIMLFPNLLVAFLLFLKKKSHQKWSWFYIFLFSQTFIIEKLQNQSITADSYYFYKHIGMLNYPAFYIALFCMLFLLIVYVNKGGILCAASLFSSISVFIGIFLSGSFLAFNFFFFSAVMIELLTSLYYTRYVYYKDEELGIANYQSYLKDAQKKYPLKYSIALMYIDEYGRLLKRYGYNKTLLLKKMFIARIKDTNEDILIYNYKDDALIFAFMNANAIESFEKAEEIRRTIAKSIFIFNENNHLQLTVSQCVSEKKRSDADAATVLLRAEESLIKACKFTRNITIKS